MSKEIEVCPKCGGPYRNHRVLSDHSQLLCLQSQNDQLRSKLATARGALRSIAIWSQEQQDLAEQQGLGIALWRGCVAEAAAALEELGDE